MMRVYGREFNPDGTTKKWVVVTTDRNGFNDNVYAVALIQVIRLQLGESPFYASSGIPAAQSVLAQIAPDIYVARIQQQYSGFFGSLTINRVDLPITNLRQVPEPTYSVQILDNFGAVLPSEVPF